MFVGESMPSKGSTADITYVTSDVFIYRRTALQISLHHEAFWNITTSSKSGVQALQPALRRVALTYSISAYSAKYCTCLGNLRSDTSSRTYATN